MRVLRTMAIVAFALWATTFADPRSSADPPVATARASDAPWKFDASGGAPARRHAGPYGWPSGQAAPVLRGFDPPAQKWDRGHRGVDLAMNEGQSVLAAGDGVVLYAGMLADRPTVSIEHADGIRTTYEPVEPTVALGDRVTRGQIIGILRGGHCPDRACLHWGAKRGRDGYFNPLSLLRPIIRLLE